jgi:hypothetical protein
MVHERIQRSRCAKDADLLTVTQTLQPGWLHHKQGVRPRIAVGDLARPGCGLLRWDLSSLPRNLVAEDMPMQSHGHETMKEASVDRVM